MPNPRGGISLADGRQVHGVDLGVQDIWEGHEAYKDLEEPIRADGCVRRVGYRWGGGSQPTRPSSGASITAYLQCRIVLFVFQMIGFPMCVFSAVFICK